MKLRKNDVILFNGDSITDCGRDISDFHSLSGYVQKIDSCLHEFHAGMNFEVFNRGVSGHRSCDLLTRIEGELKETKATVLSVLIGINDTWRRYDSNSWITTAEQYEKNLSAIFKIAKKYVREIVLMEPFLLPTDSAKDIFREDLDPKITVARKTAAEFGADFIPLDGIFAEKWIKTNPAVFSADGVHPTDAGNAVIAAEWLKRIEL